MQIRQRQDSDFQALEMIARSTHDMDRYPIYLPGGDFRQFFTQPPSIAAWVAVAEDQVVGHVALNNTTSKPVMAEVERHGTSPAAYVARLLVDPSARRTGAGRALLRQACSTAVSLDRTPALDVVDIPTAAPAVALYQAEGWEEIARVTVPVEDTSVLEAVFIWRQ